MTQLNETTVMKIALPSRVANLFPLSTTEQVDLHLVDNLPLAAEGPTGAEIMVASLLRRKAKLA